MRSRFSHFTGVQEVFSGCELVAMIASSRRSEDYFSGVRTKELDDGSFAPCGNFISG